MRTKVLAHWTIIGAVAMFALGCEREPVAVPVTTDGGSRTTTVDVDTPNGAVDVNIERDRLNDGSSDRRIRLPNVDVQIDRGAGGAGVDVNVQRSDD